MTTFPSVHLYLPILGTSTKAVGCHFCHPVRFRGLCGHETPGHADIFGTVTQVENGIGRHVTEKIEETT